ALLQKGVPPDTRGRSEDPAIVRAARAHDEVAVKHLIDAGANVNLRGQSGMSALMVAAASSSTQLTQMLLAAGARVAERDNTGRDAMWFTADAGNVEIADQLLAAGAPVESNRKQQSPLFAAVHAGRSEMVQHLIRKGLSPNAKGPEGDTPLIAAAARGDSAV